MKYCDDKGRRAEGAKPPRSASGASHWRGGRRNAPPRSASGASHWRGGRRNAQRNAPSNNIISYIIPWTSVMIMGAFLYK